MRASVLLSVTLLHPRSHRVMRAIIRVYDRSKVVHIFGLDIMNKIWVMFLKWKLSNVTEDGCFVMSPCPAAAAQHRSRYGVARTRVVRKEEGTQELVVNYLAIQRQVYNGM